ncbi:hypothetical protein ACG83_23220 [Frankia sp. R43]|uniref:type I polyketide synthase n=1 Tax=Frankia sp. R43 TaxID=269536 RepID=UPI0006CA3146|nr:type I polyketide synthase [Frankia sp. R43]KPM53561.1 hypothetical protein ACG83_23220 [Frankia sp. R43]
MEEAELGAWLRRRIAQIAGREANDIAFHEPLATYGLSSIHAVALVEELSSRLGRRIPSTVLYEFPTLGAVIAHLEGRAPTGPGSAGAGQVASGPVANEPIAIIGMGCRFPGAAGPDAFWDLLERGVDAVGTVPDGRFSRWRGRREGIDAASRARLGGFLPEVGGLDLDFFGIGEDEAARIDPQQRLILEVAWEALEDSGVDPHSLAGSPTGVFVGISSSDYRGLLTESAAVDAFSLLGGASSVAANRLSYLLDLRGPSLAVDTACSSSLVAAHLACNAIRSGECAIAVVGGVNVILDPFITAAFDSSGVMAPDGRCKAFSAQADGYVRSEGAGVIVLKALSEALRDGDRVSAVIRGSAVTSDGRTNGLLAPGRQSQEDVVRLALARAGVEPREVDYVEAHGTGTPIGDQMEASALGVVLGKGRSADQPCAIGSLKTNVGHLEAAAGVAGLIKLALCFERNALPPTLHCAQPNPDIDFDGLGLRVQSTLRRWEPAGAGAVAGVSSFGFGGTNAHAVLGPAPAAGRPAGNGQHAEQPERAVQILAFSAATEESLRAQATRHAAWVENLNRTDGLSGHQGDSDSDGEGELRKGCAEATLVRGGGGLRRRRFRAAFAFEGASDLLPRLRDPAMAPVPVPENPDVVFVFPGQGAQWVGMGQALIAAEPAFDLAISRCEQAFSPFVTWSVREVLTREGTAAELDRIDVVQPAIFAIQVGLAALFRAWGVRPAGVVGHSMGEVAAAHVCGALRLEDAARIVCRRSALMMRHRGQGAMAVVSLPVARARDLLRPYGDRLSLAAHNGPETIVVSGENEAVDEFVAALEPAGVFGRRIQVDVASHCALMDDLREDLLSELSGLSPRRATVPFYSSLTGQRFDTTALDAAYWWRNLREPVSFASAVRDAGSAQHAVFLELSPHPLLSVSVAEGLAAAGRPATALAAMRRLDERAPYEAVAALFEAGCDIDWPLFHGGPVRAGTRLPSYPWQHQECWVEPAGAPAEGTVVTGSLPAIRDHQVRQRTIAPAAWMLDAALDELNPGPASRYGLTDVLVTSPLAVAEGESRRVRVSRRFRARNEPDLTVESRPADDRSAVWEEHASAQWAPTGPLPSAPDLAAIRRRCPRDVEPEALYEHLAASGLTYGTTMRMVTGIRLGDGELLARLARPSARTRGRWLPADVADGAMQSVAALSLDGPITGTFVGFGFQRVDVFEKWSGPTQAHVLLRSDLDNRLDSFECDVNILDDAGRVLVRFAGVSLKRMRDRHTLRFLAVERMPRPRPAERADHTDEVIILADDAQRCARLVEELRSGGTTGVVAAVPQGKDGLAFLEARPPTARLVCVEPERDAFLAFLRCAARSQPTSHRELTLVTSDAALPPLLRALERETGCWSGRAIQIDATELATRELARDLAAELAAPLSSFHVHYQGGERTLPYLTQVEATSAAAPLRPRGVYWITGGQGGLGSTVAVALAREAGARLVLTGRRDRLDRGVRDAIESAGGQVLYRQADVTDETAVRRVLGEALHRFGALHGVIHTAGILDDSLLQSTSTDRMHAIMKPKELGAQVLIDVVTAEDPDFIVLFSSLASLLVTPGQGCYAAANAALDALASSARGRNASVRTINWGPWAELGMVADAEHQRGLLEAGLHPIAPPDGARAFLEFLASTHRQVAIVDVRDDVADELVAQFNRGQPDTVRAGRGGQTGWPGSAGSSAVGGSAVGGSAGGSSAVGGSATASSVAGFVLAELGRALRRAPDEIDPSVRFDRLGVDSLLAVSITRRIAAHFGLDLPATFMFTRQTVDAVTLYLNGLLGLGTPGGPEGAQRPSGDVVPERRADVAGP